MQTRTSGTFQIKVFRPAGHETSDLRTSGGTTDISCSEVWRRSSADGETGEVSVRQGQGLSPPHPQQKTAVSAGPQSRRCCTPVTMATVQRHHAANKGGGLEGKVSHFSAQTFLFVLREEKKSFAPQRCFLLNGFVEEEQRKGGFISLQHSACRTRDHKETPSSWRSPEERRRQNRSSSDDLIIFTSRNKRSRRITEIMVDGSALRRALMCRLAWLP